MSMLWGTPASWLSNSRPNGVPAGALKDVSTNWMSLAATVTAWGGPEAAGPPDAPAEPPGAGVASRAADAIAPGPALTSPMAKADSWRTVAMTIRATRPPNRILGVLPAGGFSRWPVVSARTTSRYSLTASPSQPTSVAISAMMPAVSSQPPNTRPRNRANNPNAPRNGRHDGPGMWT